MSEGDSYNVRSSAFTREFLSQPGAFLHPALQVADLRSRGRGRGITATASIPTNAELVKIPRAYTISVDSSQLHQTHAEIFDELALDSGGPDEDLLPTPWLHLILVLLHDHLHVSESRWRAYWDVLPTEFDTLMFWTEAELEELQGSAVRRHIGREKADKLFLNRVIPLIRKHALVFFSENAVAKSDEELLALCHRMGSLIMAYAFDLQIRASDSGSESGEDGWVEDREAELAMGMVPFADTMNADAEFNVHVEHESEQLTVRSLRPIEAGEELLNFYGPLPNCDLARRYGYTSELHSRYDIVELSWDLIASVIKRQLGDTAFDDATEDDVDEDSFVLEREAGEPDETGRNKTTPVFAKFPDELVNQVTTFTARGLGIDISRQPQDTADGRTLKLAFLRIMKQVLELRGKEYSTSFDEDQKRLEDDLSARMRIAIDIRLGDKRLLREADHFVKQLLEKYDDGKTQQRKQRKGQDDIQLSAKKSRK